MNRTLNAIEWNSFIIYFSIRARYRAEFGLPLSRTFVLSDLFLLPNVEFFVLDLKCADQATDVQYSSRILPTFSEKCSTRLSQMEQME